MFLIKDKDRSSPGVATIGGIIYIKCFLPSHLAYIKVPVGIHEGMPPTE